MDIGIHGYYPCVDNIHIMDVVHHTCIHDFHHVNERAYTMNIEIMGYYNIRTIKTSITTTLAFLKGQEGITEIASYRCIHNIIYY